MIKTKVVIIHIKIYYSIKMLFIELLKEKRAYE